MATKTLALSPRRLYDWVMALAHKKHATTALCCISFAEASCFPIPPDILQIAMSLERPHRSWFYAGVSTLASVLGGLFGYLIGMLAWPLVAQFFFDYVFTEQAFTHVQKLYQQWDFWVVLVAAFTPIPYKIITLAAGAFHISFIPFILACLIGRAARFFLVATLLWWAGPTMKQWIDKYFNLLTIVFVIMFFMGSWVTYGL